jgi:hypothetical protein
LISQDLEGFVTSVPQDRIKAAMTHCVSRYCSINNIASIQDANISVALQQTNSGFRVFNGTYRQASKQFQRFALLDLIDLTSWSLDVGYFTCLGTVFRQIRGSPMGAPQSPALRMLVTVIEEHMWMQT